MPLEQIEVEQLGYILGPMRKIGDASGGESYRFMHDRLAVHLSNPMDLNKLGSRWKFEIGSFAGTCAPSFKRQDRWRGLHERAVGSVQAKVLIERPQSMLWHTPGYDGSS